MVGGGTTPKAAGAKICAPARYQSMRPPANKPAMKTTAKAAKYSRGEVDRSMNTIGS